MTTSTTLRRVVVGPLLCLTLVATACGGSGDDEAEVGDALSSDRSTTRAADDSTDATTAAPASSTSAPDAAQLIEVVAQGGKPVGGVQRARVKQGSEVLLRVTSDEDDEVHVHSYDLSLDLVAGTPAELRFTADIPGVFEVELHDAGKEILELEVSP